MTALLNDKTFTLSNFEGPLDFLLYLVQKSELEIYDIPIQKITEQYLEAIEGLSVQDVDSGAEFISLATSLLLVKSRMLLPKDESEEEEDEEIDPKFEIIHQLIEYCQYKQMAKRFSQMEDERSVYYFRGEGVEERKSPKPLGLEGVSLEEIADVLQDCLVRAASRIGDDIEEEKWRVIDKIRSIRKKLSSERKIPLRLLFNPCRSKTEMIVTFLALLELVKIGDAEVERIEDTDELEVIKGSNT